MNCIAEGNTGTDVSHMYLSVQWQWRYRREATRQLVINCYSLQDGFKDIEDNYEC